MLKEIAKNVNTDLLETNPLMILQKNGEVSFLNDKARGILNLGDSILPGSMLTGDGKLELIIDQASKTMNDDFNYTQEIEYGSCVLLIKTIPVTEGGKAFGAMVFIEDVTEIRNKERENTLLYQIASTTSSVLSIQAIAEKILLQIVEIMKLSGGNIMLIDRIGGHLYVESTTIPSKIPTLGLRIGEGVAGWVAKTGQPLAIPSTASEKRFVKRISGEEDRSLLCVPLVAKGQILGVLNLWKPAGEYFKESEVQTYSVIASNIADVLESRQLRITADKRLELANILDSTLELQPLLNQAVLKISEILDNAQCSIYLWRTNKLLEGIASSHHTAHELKSHFVAITQGQVTDLMEDAGSSVINLEEWRQIGWVRDLAHRKGWREITVSGLKTKGELHGLLFIHNAKFEVKKQEYLNLIRDISLQLAMAIENVNLYAKSKREIQILDSIQKTTDQGIILLNKNRNIIYLNEAIVKILKLKKPIGGRKIDEIIKKFSELSYLRISKMKPILDLLKKDLESEISFNMDIENDLQKKHLLVDIKILKEDETNPMYLITIDDITSLRNLQENITERLHQTTQLFKISSLKVSESRQAIKRIVQRLPELLKSEESMAAIINHNGKMEVIGSSSEKLRWKNFIETLDLNEDLYGRLKKNTYYIYQQDQWQNSQGRGLPNDLRNFIVYPIVHNKMFQGLVFVANKIEKKFSREDVYLLSIATKQISSIWENNQLLEDLESEKSQLSAIINYSADGMVLVDNNRKIISWNKAMEKLTGYLAWETEGGDLLNFVRAKEATKLPTLFMPKNLKDQHGSISELEIISKNNEPRWLNVHYSRSKSPKKEMVLLFNDVSKYKELDQQKNEFISMTAHELRTPLTAIKGYLSMIIEGDSGPLNEKQEKYFQRTYNSTERLVNLVEDLLNFLRVEEKRMVFNIQPINMRQIAKETMIDFFQKASKKDMKLDLINSYRGSEMPMGDPDRTKQILGNLLDNAIKYTPRGGHITVKIYKDSKDKKNYLITEVRDTGVGLEQEQLTQIFNKFQRINNPMSTQAGGYGLGLFITKSLVEQQGGKIWVESEPGKGSIFSFSLPFKIKD